MQQIKLACPLTVSSKNPFCMELQKSLCMISMEQNYHECIFHLSDVSPKTTF